MRTKAVTFTAGALFALLLLGIFNLQVLRGAQYRRLSEKNCIRVLPQEGKRGQILDRDLGVLAGNTLSYDVLVSGREFTEDSRLMNVLSLILNRSQGELKKSFEKNFLMSSIPSAVAQDVGLKKSIAIEELKFDYPQLLIRSSPRRSYPNSRLASHVLGYLNEIDSWRLTNLEPYGYKTKDIVGFGGVEEAYDYYLRQGEGGLSFEVDHRGRFVRPMGMRLPKNGKDIQLTLSASIQKIAEDKLGQRKGSVVIINPFTGAVVAMASAPNFDPAVFVERRNDEISSLFQSPDSPLVNRAVSSGYPAGSIFKLVVATAALEEKKIKPATSFVCQGKLFVGRQEFDCWDIHGTQDLNAAIAHSCNVFLYKAGLLVGADKIHDYAVRFGFARSSGFELPNEERGFIPSAVSRRMRGARGWFDGDTANLSIGQGEVLVTPLQAVRMIAVFANGGFLVYPYIVQSIDGRNVSSYQRKPVSLGLKKQTIEVVRQGLRDVVLNSAGTGHVLSALPVQVAGKTGTAQAPPGLAHAWFCGFFPVKEPQYAICVLLEHGGPGYYSCLVAGEIIEEMSVQGLL